MKFAFRFSNLLGTVYRQGNLTFTNDDNRLISPVGNRLTIFDLKNNKSETLPVESKTNITAVTLSPDGTLLIAVSEEGEAILANLVRRSVLHYFHFNGHVNAISFSPDGSKFAVTKDNTVQVYHSPGRTKEFNPFVLYRTFYGAYDETVSIDWTSDSRAFCVGGKDMNTRIYGAQKFKNLIVFSLGGHTDCIVNAFFEEQSLDLYSLGANGQLCIWECDTDLAGLVPDEDRPQKGVASRDDDLFEGVESETDEADKITEESSGTEEKIMYKRISKQTYREARGEGSRPARITSAAFHKASHIMCTGFSDGAFFLHEMPDFNLIHSLSISDQHIASVVFNRTGDWLALGCGGLGQLIVWEWQSESYVLKQQGHFNNMECVDYSPDGQHLVTGGDDAKVKVWNTSSGFCFVTFSEHHAAVKGVSFNQNGQVVVSASLDGTVRAFDLNRYRNFRTFTSPHPVQFNCLAIDHSGEVVCAGGQDVFEIFVWSMQTGRLLEILAGHEGPVSSITFSAAHSILASGSWDKTVKLWDIFENKGSRETLTLNADVVGLAYRPDGKELAVATLNGQLSMWDVPTASQVGTIEGRHDLGYTRKEGEKITAKKSAAGKYFSTLCYTADGKCLLAGGRAKNVCIYSVSEKILVKKFEITCNFSLDGIQEFLDRRKMTEFGSLALVEEATDDRHPGQKISLPGVKKGDLSSRSWRPEVRVTGVQFSPTGRAWAATTTEGLLIYSLDSNLVFDPFDLEIDITPENVKRTLADGQYSTALMLAFRLNEQRLIEEVLEQIPVSDVDYVSSSLPSVYVDKLLAFVAGRLEASRHLEFYLRWTQRLLYNHGTSLKQRAPDIMATLRSLQKAMTRRHTDLAHICDYNKYTLQFVLSMSKHKRKEPESDNEDINDNASEDSDASWANIVNEQKEQLHELDSDQETASSESHSID